MLTSACGVCMAKSVLLASVFPWRFVARSPRANSPSGVGQFCLQRMGPEMAHLYGPAARCKLKVMIWRSWVLRFCIRPLTERLSSWPSWISARARSHSRLGPEGHKGLSLPEIKSGYIGDGDRRGLDSKECFQRALYRRILVQ